MSGPASPARRRPVAPRHCAPSPAGPGAPRGPSARSVPSPGPPTARPRPAGSPPATPDPGAEVPGLSARPPPWPRARACPECLPAAPPRSVAVTRALAFQSEGPAGAPRERETLQGPRRRESRRGLGRTAGRGAAPPGRSEVGSPLPSSPPCCGQRRLPEGGSLGGRGDVRTRGATTAGDRDLVTRRAPPAVQSGHATPRGAARKGCAFGETQVFKPYLSCEYSLCLQPQLRIEQNKTFSEQLKHILFPSWATERLRLPALSILCIRLGGLKPKTKIGLLRPLYSKDLQTVQ